jgi:hypothetical protein
MTYVWRLIASSLFVATAVPSVALAADNEKIAGSFSFTSTRICADPVLVDGSYDEQMHTFYDSSGVAIRMSFTGTVRISYTDVATGSTYRPNSSGPGTIDLRSGQTVIRGGNGAFFDANGNLVAADGRAVLDADGNVISFVGHAVDVCARLGTTPAS